MSIIYYAPIKALARQNKFKEAEELIREQLSKDRSKDRCKEAIYLNESKTELLLLSQSKQVYKILITAINWYSPTSYIIKHRLKTSQNWTAYQWLIKHEIINKLPQLKGKPVYHSFY